MSMPEILEKDMSDTQKMLWHVTSISTNNNELRTQVAKHHKLLVEGNGELPIVEQVRNLNTFVNNIKYWLRFIVSALLLQTLAFVGTAILYLIKLYPLLEQLSKNNP